MFRLKISLVRVNIKISCMYIVSQHGAVVNLVKFTRRPMWPIIEFGLVLVLRASTSVTHVKY